MGNKVPSEYNGANCSDCNKRLPPCKSFDGFVLQTIDRMVRVDKVYVFLEGQYYRIKDLSPYYCPTCFWRPKNDYVQEQGESQYYPIMENLESIQHTACNGDKEDHDRILRKLAKSIKDKVKPSEEEEKSPLKNSRKRSLELEGASASAGQGVMKRVKTENLKLANIDTIVTRLYNARVEWFSLGMALGVDYNTLEDIDKQHGDNKRCLQEMIACRLRSGTDLEPLTWKEICDSLRKSTVGRNNVAEEIETALQSET